ncbi:MAG: hypothetical protein CVU77_03025 [Elusimicrobia bacterium HGW-Elusimicrobia-1]|jgi:hypothetical protein|nr:MAG: hypothetical protein CVU77_03025 [Elusimicrobia bacterium HGW-Elusimicrobia-1]
MNTAKLTVTIPCDKYERIEKEKKQKGLNRSAFVNLMISFFFQEEDEAEKVKRYISGYKKKPEDIKKIAAFENIQSKSLGEF